jgi:hypothetical protein
MAFLLVFRYSFCEPPWLFFRKNYVIFMITEFRMHEKDESPAGIYSVSGILIHA